MNVDQAYEVFRSQGEGLKAALAWTLENWDEASDRLLSKLRSLCANLAEGDRDGADALFWITHLFADRRDTRAFGPLCARLARERSRETWLGDAATESLTNVLISLYEDDLAPLTAIIWSQEADELVRGAAIEAFGYLVRCQKALPDAEAMAFLRTFYETGKPRGESWVWVAWSFTVARLGMTDLAANAARLFSRNWIDEEYTDIQDFQALLGQARAKPELVFEEEGLGPFGSALELVDLYLTDKAETGGSEDAEEDNWGGDSTSAKEPNVNPMRDVGRNDPCPCGSGKKFKKCCLAA